MSGPATTLWARAFVDELARCGVREVALAPGSRSTPLVLALATDGRLRLRVHLDERSAAFFALGVGKTGGAPAAVVTTSGTAAANLFPAVVEASQGEVPLLLLTADRPPRLRGADANQAIDQARLFGRYPRSFFELAQPELSGPAVRHLRSVACRAVAASAGPVPGPVHVNLPFDKPFEPEPESEEIRSFAQEHPLAAAGRADGRPWVTVETGAHVVGADALWELRDLVAGAHRGVVIAGPARHAADHSHRGARTLARAAGFPLLADPLSGVRFGGDERAVNVAGYDLFLRDPVVRETLTPDLIVRVGRSPTSAALQRWLFHHNGIEHVVLDAGGRWKDHGATATRYLTAEPEATLGELCEGLESSADEGWTAAWRTASEAAARVLAEAPEEDHEGGVLAQVAGALTVGATLFVSNSMPVRDLDAFAPPDAEGPLALGSRGASGIDGIVSTAFGLATAGPVVCVLGDLAFFHDQNGLLWSREDDLTVVFVLVDNDGGAIFHMLPVAEQEPHFTKLFATPHGLDFAHAAELHGVPFADVPATGVAEALREAVAAGKTRILRVRTDRTAGQARRTAVAERVARSVRDALG